MHTRMTLQEARRRVETSDDGEYGVLLEHGSMQLGFYRPGKIDPQTPHDQDEIYIVSQGSGTFLLNGKRQAFEAGEALFVAAGAEHRFEDYTEDFCAWVIFYGPEGGETA